MGLLWRILGTPKIQKEITALHLLSTRFRHLIKSYGKILDLITDAAEKQSGHFILDKQYIISLTEMLFEHGESIIFDLNVMTKQRYVDFLDAIERFKPETKKMLEFNAELFTEKAETRPKMKRERFEEAKKEELALELAKFPVIFKEIGQVVCRGVGAGPVYNMKTREGGDFPDGGVLVASDIVPDEEVIRMIRKASAILTDYGKVAGHMASIAREFCIPAIVGLKNATDKLLDGSIVTVDADDGVVYAGKIEHLLRYYANTDLSLEEEEYKLLRKVRRYLFPLTLSADKSTSSLDCCNTFHDLIHLAHELAGEKLAEFILADHNLKKAFNEILVPSVGKVMVLDMLKDEKSEAHDTINIKNVNSPPFHEFLAGIKEYSSKDNQESKRFFTEPVYVMRKDELCEVIMQTCQSFDMLDALLSDDKTSNYIYCRFSENPANPEKSLSRCAIADKVLSKLNFAVARTSRAVTAWLGGTTKNEALPILKMIGKLTAYLYSAEFQENNNQLRKPTEDFLSEIIFNQKQQELK